jgi:hypothetical protein
MIQEPRKTGRMPERSATISGDEAKGLTPIAAVQNDEETGPSGDGAPAPPPAKPILPPAPPSGVLEHLADRS